MTVDLNGIRLRNRLLTSASLLGYGASKRRLILYGLSPIAQWVPLERFGAVTTRTLTLQPREGHFTLKEDWALREFPAMLRLYGRALHRVDAGWLNAFGWSNIGIERYFDEYFERTAGLNRIVSVGGFSADEIEQLIETVNERAKPGEIAAVELNASCHNVNFPFETILEESLRRAVPKSRHPVILKVSPDEDYSWQARLAETNGCAAITAINTVKGLRLDPETGDAVPQEPVRGGVGARDQADRAAGRRRAARPGDPPPDHRERRHPHLRRLPRVRLGRRRRGEPRLRGLAPADAAVCARAARGASDQAPDRPDGAVRAARGRTPLAPGRCRRRPGRARGHARARRAVRTRLTRRMPASTRPRVAIVTTGGTIDSVGVDRLDLAAYLETGVRLAPGELVAGISPELATIADAVEVPFRRLRAHALTDGDLADLVDLVRGLVERGEADGVVVTHGTNTLEETAWLFHLVVASDCPVVLTGAMRPASALSGDGPLNVVNAVRLAAAPAARELGTLVLLDDTIHGARDVTKTDTMRLSAFRDGAGGPLGWVDGDGRVVLDHRPARGLALRGAFADVDLRALPRADIVLTYLGADGALVDAAVAAGARVIVSAGTGAGYPTPGEVAALEHASEAGVVVCQATRVGGGRVPLVRSLESRGWIAADDLPPWKARILLRLALASGVQDRESLQALFDG